MKSFLKSIILFSFPLLLLAYPLDVYLSNKLKQSNDYSGEFEVWNAIYEGNIDTEIAIYGASTAWVDINPQVLSDTLNKSAYNLGIDGHHFWLQYLRHLEFLEHNEKPKEIILAIGFSVLEKRKDLYLYEQFLPYMLWNKDIKYYTQSYDGFSFFDYYIPLWRYAGERDVLKNISKMKDANSEIKLHRTKGFKGIDKKWNFDFEKAKFKIKEYNVVNDSLTLTLFDAFLYECKNDNIKVTLVYPPEFIEGQKFIKNRQDMVNLYHQFAEKYNITFLDYSQSNICTNKDYFYNATHLNKTGSKLFSEQLAQDLKNIK
jgi:hypothetical protein